MCVQINFCACMPCNQFGAIILCLICLFLCQISIHHISHCYIIRIPNGFSIRFNHTCGQKGKIYGVLWNNLLIIFCLAWQGKDCWLWEIHFFGLWMFPEACVFPPVRIGQWKLFYLYLVSSVSVKIVFEWNGCNFSSRGLYYSQ